MNHKILLKKIKVKLREKYRHRQFVRVGISANKISKIIQRYYYKMENNKTVHCNKNRKR